MKRTLLMGTALVALACAPAYATDAEILAELKAMRSQIDSLKGEVGTLKKQLSEAKADAKASKKVTDEIKAAKANPANDVKISMVPAPKFETADGNYSFKVGGFAQIDAGWFDDDRRDHPDGTNVRRARLNASGVIAKDFKYKIENDFAGNASNLTDVYLEYTGLDPFSIMVGQFKEPFGLETLTSDLFTSFIERSTTFAFSPDRRIGVAFNAYNVSDKFGSITGSIGGFGASTGTTTSIDDEAKDLTGRLTWAPFADKTQVLHFGVAGSHRVPDSATDAYAVTSRAENQLSTAAADLSVSTSLTGVDSVDLLGLETAGVYGPFSVQGEYVVADVDRRTGLYSPTFDGYYVEASYFLTGESRNYLPKLGKFDRVTPQWSFSPKEGQWGAWQIAARYSNLDLNDGPVHGGRLEDVTLGLRWYPNANVAVIANYIRSNTDRYAVTPNDDPQLFILRTQFDF